MPIPENDEEISYLALERGTAVVSTSGNEFGTVEHVLQVPELDLFDGIVVRVHHSGRRSHRFVDRDQIDTITRHRVRTLLTDEEAENLPVPTGTPVEVPEGPRRLGSSYNSTFGRMFGREHWRQKN
jgi:hypothetical protein